MVSPPGNRPERFATLTLRAAILVLIGLVFYLGIRSERTGFVRDVLDPGLRRLRDPVLNAFRDRPPPVPLVQLELDSAAFDTLEERSRTALGLRRVIGSRAADLRTTLMIDDRRLEIVVGLREGMSLPGKQRHWPLTVRALSVDTTLAMGSFDMIPVQDAAPLWSIVLHTLLRDSGSPSLNSIIAEVHINEEDRGLHALFEKPDATALARWHRGTGPVLRFEDDLHQRAEQAMERLSLPSDAPPQGDWLAAPLLLHAAHDETSQHRAQTAVRNMEGFRAGDRRASDVFDVHATARLMAFCDLLGTPQAMAWWDLRFIMDSTDQRIVPFPLHITEAAPIRSILGQEAWQSPEQRTPGRELVHAWMQDPIIQQSYLAALDSLSSLAWWRKARARNAHSWEPMRLAVHAELPGVDLDTAVIAHDRAVIQQTLHPADLVLAYVADTLSRTTSIAVANVHALPVEVLSVVLADGDTARPYSPLRLEPRQRDRPLRYAFVPLLQAGVPREVIVRIAPGLPPRSVKVGTWSSYGAN